MMLRMQKSQLKQHQLLQQEILLSKMLANACIRRFPPPLPDLVVFGEIGLAGEVRPVANGEQRIQEAAKHGFKRAIVPHANKPKSTTAGFRVDGIHRLHEALDLLE